MGKNQDPGSGINIPDPQIRNTATNNGKSLFIYLLKQIRNLDDFLRISDVLAGTGVAGVSIPAVYGYHTAYLLSLECPSFWLPYCADVPSAAGVPVGADSSNYTGVYPVTGVLSVVSICWCWHPPYCCWLPYCCLSPYWCRRP